MVNREKNIILFLSFFLWINVGSAQTFLPTDIGGLSLWLSPEDSNLTLSGNRVSLWKDLSGNNNDAYQTDTSLQPHRSDSISMIDDKSAIHFDGVDDNLLLNAAINNIRTVFILLQENPVSTYTCRPLLGHTAPLYDFHRGDDCRKIWGFNTNINIRNGNTNVNGQSVNGLVTNMPTTYSIVSVNTLGNVSADNISTDRSITNRGWDGDLVEIIIYDQPLTNQQTQDVEQYLRNKYA